jgi:predicted nucleic acid-binding protein
MNLVIDVVVMNAVVHVHVSKASIALSVTLSMVKICTGQHDTIQDIMNPMVKSATLQVTSLRAVVDSVILSNLMSVGSNILISLRFAAF